MIVATTVTECFQEERQRTQTYPVELIT